MAIVLGDAPGALVGLPMLAAQIAQLVGAAAVVWLDRCTATGNAGAEPTQAGPRAELAPVEAELREQAALGRVAGALAGGAAPADARSLVAAEAAQACGLPAGARARAPVGRPGRRRTAAVPEAEGRLARLADLLALAISDGEAARRWGRASGASRPFARCRRSASTKPRPRAPVPGPARRGAR
jgi:hypothetical protein